MELKILSAQELLTSKKLSTYSIDTIHIEKFKKHLEQYRDVIQKTQDTATEETQKQKLKDLLSAMGHYQHEMNHQSIDLSLWDNNKLKVIVETKIKKSVDMITDDNPNKKAFQEALYYYIEQLQEQHQDEISYIMITNFQYMYLFEEKEFLNLKKKSAIANA